MKSCNISFVNVNELEVLFDELCLNDSKTLLVQAFFALPNKQDIKELQLLLKNRFPLSTLIGTTTDGVIDSGEIYTQKTSVLNFIEFEKTVLKSSIIEHNISDNYSYESGRTIAKNIICEDTKVIISFADAINTNGEEYANGIYDVNGDIILAGGLAADNGKLENTFVFDKDTITSNGAVAVCLIGKDLNISNNYSFDWIPIGKKMKITKADKNRLYEIDGFSAVDIYSKYMGEDIAQKLPQIGIEFPLIFERDSVLIGRAILSKHDDGSLTFAGNIQEGDSVRFGVGNIENILSHRKNNLKELVEKSKYKSEVALVYSCMARRRYMGDRIVDEIKPLLKLGNVAGFFTYGEFYHSKNSNLLLNETMTAITLSENNQSYDKASIYRNIDELKVDIKSEHALAHLVNKVSSELAELNENLEQKIQEHIDLIYKQAYFNQLTNLPNRISLIKELDESKWDLILLVNIDSFTMINDFYGHEIGDKVLQKTASILCNFIKDKDAKVFKLPSDEFALLLNTDLSLLNIEKNIKELIYEVDKEVFLFDNNNIHVSVTVSSAPVSKEKNCFANADMSLKQAKKSGKNYVMYSDDMNLSKNYETNIKMANILKNAIYSDDIIPYFQPIYDLKTGKIEKYETLVRLKKSADEVLTPYFFLDISQKIKLYHNITEIMVKKTFSFFATNGLNFSINLSIADILNINTREYIFDKIKEYGIATQLTIEILETQEIENEEMVKEFIKDIYEVGAKIAIDDFGSGFANFEHMTKIESDYMKIDGSLIKDIDSDLNAMMVVETIVLFAKKLGKKTIAEFVSSEEILDVVKSLGIDYAQGYYLGKPKGNIVS